MLNKKKTMAGAFFGDAYKADSKTLAAVLELITPSEVFDAIYMSDQINVYRIFSQTKTSRPMEFNITFIGELADESEWIITSGTICTNRYIEEIDLEKIGKRILYNAIRQHWNIRF